MYEILKFDLGRNALRYVVRAHNIKQMHIPYYLCDVVRHTLFEEGCKPNFYHIDDNFYPVCEFDRNNYILYPNYWGICGRNVEKLAKMYPKLIVDNAHAYFDNPSGFACFNAGHKFGYKESVLWIKSSLKVNFSVDIKNFNNDELRLKRNKDFLNIHNKYKDINLLDIDLNSIPFCYPCLVDTVECANTLVRQLNNEGKTIFRYWKNLPKNFNEYKFYSRLVPISI